MREREGLFNEFIVDVRRREKDEKQAKKEQVCAGDGVSIATRVHFRSFLSRNVVVCVLLFCNIVVVNYRTVCNNAKHTHPPPPHRTP